MMFPHTVTVYNTTEDLVTFEQSVSITVLRGVLMDASKAVNVRTSGLVGADSVNLYIPFDVEATDGISKARKRYLPPKEYEKSTDKSGVWTLRTDGCFFVKGEVVVPDSDFQHINRAFDDVHMVTSVDEKDFGSLKHWEVGGA